MGSVILAQVSTGELFVYMIVACAVGCAGTWVFRSLQAKAKLTSAENEADRLTGEAQSKAQEIVRTAEVEAKASFLELQTGFDKQTAATRNEIREAEKRLDKREDQLERQLDMLRIKERNIEKTEGQIQEKLEQADNKAGEIDELLAKQRNELQRVSQLSTEEAKNQLFTRLEQELEQECAKIVAKRVAEAQEESENRSREIVVTAIQRYSAAHTAESTVSTIDILSDEMKGRVIGREGRNIRAFEKATGVDIIVDDTPGVIEVSCFDPVRKEIATQAMNRLLRDGRIHPTRIEDVVEEVRTGVEKQIIEYGKKAAMEANVQGLNKKLVNLLGRLHFRTSYGQSVLRHSVEVAYLCQVMADELGLNGTLGRRCGLLHDIGKAMDRDIEGGHPAIGEEICRKFNERPEVLNAIAGHHGDVPSTNPYTPLVTAADAISAARPGSRREALERYIKRLKQLEDIAIGFQGVEQAYAIQAGREVRVIVNANSVNDSSAMRIARDVANKIEAEMTYPGEIKVTLLREVRAVEYAK